MISITCSCGKRLKTGEKYAGRTTKCPNCGAPVSFPKEDLSAFSAIRMEDEADESPAVAEEAEIDPPPPVGRIERLLIGDIPEPNPSPVKEVVQTIAATQASPVRRDAEPAAYFWADFLAGVMSFLAVAQLVITTVLVVIVQAEGSGAGSSSGDGPRPDTTGPTVMTLAYSFGLAVSSVLAASLVGVIVDGARTLRQLRAELRAK